MSKESFYPLPSAFPLGEIQYLLGFLKGDEYDAATTIQAGWALAGYAQRQVMDSVQIEEAEAGGAEEAKAPKPKRHKAVHALSCDELEKALKTLAKHAPEPTTGPSPSPQDEKARLRDATPPTETAEPEPAKATKAKGLADLGLDWKALLKSVLTEVIEKLLKEL